MLALMERSITAFDRDSDGHWFAWLSCGHRQHVRHDPPLISRPWVLTEEGRAPFIGTALDCVRCNQLEIPLERLVWTRDSPRFTDQTIPDAFRAAHRTADGVWGQIEVFSGELVLCTESPAAGERLLRVGAPGIIAPAITHHIQLRGAVEFQVHFFKVSHLEEFST